VSLVFQQPRSCWGSRFVSAADQASARVRRNLNRQSCETASGAPVGSDSELHASTPVPPPKKTRVRPSLNPTSIDLIQNVVPFTKKAILRTETCHMDRHSSWRSWHVQVPIACEHLPIVPQHEETTVPYTQTAFCVRRFSSRKCRGRDSGETRADW